jgi:predicted RNase H-like nuclease (RuvC/YqgF family)
MSSLKSEPSPSIVDHQKIIRKQYDVIEKLLGRVETLKSKNKTLKTKLKKMSNILEEATEEVHLYKSYCKGVTHIKWD